MRNQRDIQVYVLTAIVRLSTQDVVVWFCGGERTEVKEIQHRIANSHVNSEKKTPIWDNRDVG